MGIANRQKLRFNDAEVALLLSLPKQLTDVLHQRPPTPSARRDATRFITTGHQTGRKGA
jgi:hypothetical protein